jgi:hypothetical protein
MEERERSQVAGVTGWFAPDPDGRMGIWGTLIRNDSGLPVYEVRTSFHYIQEPVKGLPWTPVSQGVSTERVRVLPPRSEQFIQIPPEVRNQLPECSDEVYAAGITFTDAAGNRWERDPKGALHPWG